MCAFPLGQALYGALFDWAKQYAFIVVLFAGLASVVIALLSKGVLLRISQRLPQQTEGQPL